MKKKNFIILIIILNFIFIGNVLASEKNMESVVMLDVARKYYKVEEIKEYIDALSVNENSTLQLHFTDDENVGIECKYLDQTVENATIVDGAYTNPLTNKQFLSHDQVIDLINYSKQKGVNLVPEISLPAHMNGFFTLAINKFGESYVRNRYDWDNPSNSGIAWGTLDEMGNLDLMSPNALVFARSLLDEYTELFKDCKYFHVGFDEYTFRPEMKIDYANELYNYLKEKGFIMRMWSDAITKDNINDLNNNVQITYWGWKNEDITSTNYATVKDLQEKGFKILITNKYYLFFVPNTLNTDQYSLDYTINEINNEWNLDKWNYNYSSNLDNYDNILGSMVCTWSEQSNGVSNSLIKDQTIKMYNAMFKKLPKIVINKNQNINQSINQSISLKETNSKEVDNPKTLDNVSYNFVSFQLCLFMSIRFLLKLIRGDKNVKYN